MEEEKDIFDLFREGSENLTEQPPTEAWQRLEKRLATVRKRKRPERKPLHLQLPVITTFVILLVMLGAVSWYFTQLQQDILKGQKEFREFYFLKGEWISSEKKMVDVMVWDFKDSTALTGAKSLYYSDKLLSNTPISIKNMGKTNLLTFDSKSYELKEILNNTFIFKARDKEEVRLRKAADNRFTLSFGEGIVFVFKKE